jgi:hypothetical protein
LVERHRQHAIHGDQQQDDDPADPVLQRQPGLGGEKTLEVHGSHRRQNGLGVVRPCRGSRPYQ